ncbi:MAG: LCP family protein [Anaerolineales bacterium]|nr:LCP family protein [Anaerolineales bacterium]
MSKKISLDRKTLLRLGLPALIGAIILVVGIATYAAARSLALTWASSGGLPVPSFLRYTPTPALDAQGNPILETPEGTPVAIAPSLNPWDGANRVTVLVLGLDERDWGASENAWRSDTMILLTLDPLTKTAGMLSIPRDLWVDIPGFKHGKINTAYYLGDAYKLPGGGPALAVKTVEQFLGVPINYYAQIDFDAFVRFIDEIGGVEIDVPEKITIDLLGGGFKTKKTLKPGRQVLPGEWALAYARARYSEGGDFDRAARQQQVIMAIRDRMLSAEMLTSMITKAPALYNELASGVRTNLSLDEIIKLALLAQSVSEENIQKGIIGESSVLFGFSPDNLSILIPIPDKINLVRDQVFASAGALGPETPGAAQDQMKAEAAKTQVYNASRSPDILSRTVDYLRGLGVNILQTGASENIYTSTTIIDHTGNPFTVKYLVDLLHIHPSRIYLKYDPNSPADVEIYLGDDWAAQNSLP